MHSHARNIGDSAAPGSAAIHGPEQQGCDPMGPIHPGNPAAACCQALGLTVALSRLSVLECRVAPLRRGSQVSLVSFSGLFAQSDLQIVELSASVVELPIKLRLNPGLRTPDALQAACFL